MLTRIRVLVIMFIIIIKIQLHEHYNANNIYQRYNINLCCINIISNYFYLAVLNLHDKKTEIPKY